MDGTIEGHASVTQDRFRKLHSRRGRPFRAGGPLLSGTTGLAADAIDEAMAPAYARWERMRANSDLFVGLGSSLTLRLGANICWEREPMSHG